MLLPIRSKNPPESIPFVTIALMVINVVVYTCTSNGLEIKEQVLNDWGLKSSHFDFVHMTSSMFLHGSLLHILGNMWFLYLFGFAAEGRLKPLKFAIVYFAAGYAGDFLHHLILGQSSPNVPSIGASGAIMGVLGAALWMFPHGKVTFFYWIRFNLGTFDWPMWGVALLYLGLDILEAVIFAGKDGVGHFAHIGGAAAGVAVCMLFRPKRDDAMASDSKATLSETKDLSLLSRQELANLHKTNPTDMAIVVNWMYKSLRDPAGVKPECKEVFLKNLPKLLQEQEPGPIGMCLMSLNDPAGTISSKYLIDCAGKLEKINDNMTAMRMYEVILKDTNAPLGDHEMAMFRGGLLSEAVFQRFDSAQVAYRTLIDRWPMSPFADQARARLKYVEGKLAQSANP